MIYDLIYHQNKANLNIVWEIVSLKCHVLPEGVYRPRSMCEDTHTCALTHSCHWSSSSVAASAIILISKEVGIKDYNDFIFPLFLCKTALGGCMHLKLCVLAFMVPTSWSQASCWVRVACLLQTDPHRLYLQVNTGKESSKGCVGFCWSFFN